MKTAVVELSHHVEQEGVCVVVESLVVEEELGQQTEILSIAFVFSTIDLEKRNRLLPVNLISRRVSKVAFGNVSLQAFSTFSIFETKLTNVDALESAQFLRVGRKVPGLDSMLSQFDELDVLHSRNDIVVVCNHTARLSWCFLRWLLRVIVYGWCDRRWGHGDGKNRRHWSEWW